VQETFDKEMILHRLMSQVTDDEMRGKVQAIARARDIPEERVCAYVKDLYKLSLPADNSGAHSQCQKMAVMVKQVCARHWSVRATACTCKLARALDCACFHPICAASSQEQAQYEWT
jgi:hypothetical protein